MGNSPLYNKIKTFAQPFAHFHVPGHKGNANAIPPFGGILPYDLSEIDGADDLMNPTNIIAQSQNNMAQLYGSGACLYSASGSTSCIQAMLHLFVPAGGTVVMARNCHVSAVRALAFLGANAQWVLPQNGYVSAKSIHAALQESGAKVVYITSPDYYGHISDIEEISAVCKQFNAKLLVDNAHGAHLQFLHNADGHSLHPLSLGADATADSAHKTLPCLTPAAMLHLANAQFAPAARRVLNLYCSTSPSYLVLQSLDIAANYLAKNPLAFAKAAHKLAFAGSFASHMLMQSDDPLKLCLCPAKGGWQYADIIDCFEKAGIIPELADGTRIVLMASPWNKEEDFELLQKVFLRFKQKTPLKFVLYELELPKTELPVRDCVFGNTKQIATKNGLGHILASIAAPCPPGMPPAIPGERLSQNAIDLFLASGILTIDVLK